MKQYIEILKNTGSVNVGYRSSCGYTDPSVKSFREFEKLLKDFEKTGDVIKKTPVKVDNSYATIKGGFWNEFKYEFIKSELVTRNVRLIINEKYRLISNTIPRAVRKELNEAVKNGILGHFKKDGICKECYFFVSHEYAARNAIYNDAVGRLQSQGKVLV
ncbi:MAG: hypothetical protein PHE67_00145 [Campylobacterales bacterium]|nr:hypothetical protein [Campylobacterales bacterium]